MTPPRRMRLREVPDYVELKTGNRPTLQSVYNWTMKGKDGVTLKFVWTKQRPTSVFPDMRMTTAAWVDQFLAEIQSRRGM